MSLVLAAGLSGLIAIQFRTSILKNWEAERCNPGVVPFSGLFKPADDPRSISEFARDNWSFCKKEYIQNAIRVSTQEVSAVVDSQGGVVDIVQQIITDIAEMFSAIWKAFYQAYAAFMERARTTAKLFQNFMINLHNIIDRLQGAIFSITMAIISALATFINTIQLVLIVVIIVIGILLILQIILFYLLAPISGLIMAMAVLAQVVVVVVVTAIMAATVSGACFAPDTIVCLREGDCIIQNVRVGDVLIDGGVVTAVHEFLQPATMYSVDGIHVSGDHLDASHNPVRERTDAKRIVSGFWSKQRLWCLTTSTRRIHCRGTNGPVAFADWEEIPEDDSESLMSWYRRVWNHLNGEIAAPPISRKTLMSDAAISTECLVGLVSRCSVIWIPAKRIQIGDTIICGKNGESTRVVGTVNIDSDEIESMILQGSEYVSCATWVQRNGELWNMPHGRYVPVDQTTFMHLYTESGTFAIGSDEFIVRDASEVGLHELKTLVESVIVPPKIK